MNKELVCPFCQQELKDQWLGQNVAHEYFNCPKCKMNGNPKLWQELIRTRKALELALKELKQLKYGGKADRIYLKNKAGKALEQITALEQKDK